MIQTPYDLRARLQGLNLKSVARLAGVKYSLLYAFMRRDDDYISFNLFRDLSDWVIRYHSNDEVNPMLPQAVGCDKPDTGGDYETYVYDLDMPDPKVGDVVWLSFKYEEKLCVSHQAKIIGIKDNGKILASFMGGSRFPDQFYFSHYTVFNKRHIAAIEASI